MKNICSNMDKQKGKIEIKLIQLNNLLDAYKKVDDIDRLRKIESKMIKLKQELFELLCLYNGWGIIPNMRGEYSKVYMN